MQRQWMLSRMYLYIKTIGMKRRRIVLSVTNDLVTDQRVHRSATALQEAGYDVTLVGRLLPDSPPVERSYRTVRMRLLFRRKAVFYAEYNIRLLLRLLFMRADAFYANDTDTLLANWVASRLRAKPIFFDAHEMFPEVPELVGRPRVKRFWTRIEDRILPKLSRRGAAAVTVCQSIADIYAERYGLRMGVVRNVPWKRRTEKTENGERRTENDRRDRMGATDVIERRMEIDRRDRMGATDVIERRTENDRRERFVLLYQGAVNIGRGIEWVMDAMPLLPECQFAIAGTGDVYDELKTRKERKGLDNVVFLGRLEPEALHAVTATASLGISLLENRGLNYYYSLPNRIADFVQAGVPVLATDFPEIRRVVEGYGIGTLVPPQPFDAAENCSEPPSPELLAQTIRETLAYWESMPAEERAARFRRAADELSFEKDKKVLLSAVETIFEQK